MDEIKNSWGNILNYLIKEFDFTEVSVNTWIKPMELYRVDKDTVYIMIPDKHVQMIDYINKKYLGPLNAAVNETTNHMYTVQFITPDDTDNIVEETFQEETPKIRSVERAAEYASLNPKYTFDTFVVGENNRFTYSACLAVAESPGELYNPLFLYGGVGLGKTHLMHSIAHHILDNMPEKKVIYVTCESFTNEVIEAIRNTKKNNLTNSMSSFREKYRNVDVLLIDDIQFLKDKISTQEEFFHTFNHLYNNGKHIIISSDRPPKELEALEERLLTRFEAGLSTNISSPSYENRMAILKQKDKLENCHMSNDVLNYIAANITSNIRELEGALNKLVAYHNLEQKEITLEIAEQELRDIVSPNSPREITMDLIINVVTDHYNISEDDILSKKRDTDIALPRQIIMYLCRTLTENSLKDIGNRLGKRDHSTVKHGVDKITKDYKEETQIKNIIDTLTKKINPH